MPDRASPILLSVHDVMPSTLPRVSDLLDKLTQTGAGPADLLVVPGLDWRPDQIETLAGWHRAGHRLAGHGWCHRARHIRGWRHRLHSALISRDVAEHLALDRAGIADLIRRCHAWFGDHDLPSPTLYVPPAWAMGRISRTDLAALPFDRYEVLSGLIERDGAAGRDVRWRAVPMIGFEADTAWRAAPVRLWNVLNRGHAAFWRTPLRVAIHPHDLSLALGGALRRTLTDLADLAHGRAEGHGAAPGPGG